MESLKGQLLVASPSLLDPNFFQTVVLILEHNEDGAAGIVLNRSTGRTIGDIWEAVFHEPTEWEKGIDLGGPVTGPLTAMHSIDELADAEILPGVWTTMDPGKLREIVARQVDPCRFFVNYAGWGPGQLEGELEQDSWLIAPARAGHVFELEDIDLWRTVMGEIGVGKISQALGGQDLPTDPTIN